MPEANLYSRFRRAASFIPLDRDLHYSYYSYDVVRSVDARRR